MYYLGFVKRFGGFAFYKGKKGYLTLEEAKAARVMSGDIVLDENARPIQSTLWLWDWEVKQKAYAYQVVCFSKEEAKGCVE